MAAKARMINFMAEDWFVERLDDQAKALGTNRSDFLRLAVERMSAQPGSGEHQVFVDRVGFATEILSDLVERRAQADSEAAAQGCRMVARHLLHFAEKITSATEAAAFLADEVVDLPARRLKANQPEEATSAWSSMYGRINAEAEAMTKRLQPAPSEA
jgi:hypothetical protein